MAEKVNWKDHCDCRVTYGDDWIEVQSLSSNKTYKLDVSLIDNNWCAFTPEESKFFDFLMSKMSPHILILSASQVRMFLACIEKTKEPVTDGQPYIPEKGDVEVIGIEPLRQDAVPPAVTNTMRPYVGQTGPMVFINPNVVPNTTTMTEADAPAIPHNVFIPTPVKATPKKPDSTHNERVRLAVEATANSGYVMFIYDIPQRLNVLNPSGRMWRHGFRANLSCWIMPAGQISRIQDILEVFTANDISWHIVEYAESARAKIREMAEEALRAETARIHGSLIATIDEATKQFNSYADSVRERLENPQSTSDLLSPKEMEKKAKYREARIRAALKTAGENLNKAVESAVLFDEFKRLDDLFSALRGSIASRNEAFMAEVAMRARF